MSVAVKLDLKTPARTCGYLVAFDHGQVQNGFLPILTAFPLYLNIAADKADTRDTGRYVRDRVVNIIGKYG